MGTSLFNVCLSKIHPPAGVFFYAMTPTHYDHTIQPIDFINANKLPYSEGNVVKYITRHERKNGAEDIVKAIHYCTFILRDRYGKTNEEISNILQSLV